MASLSRTTIILPEDLLKIAKLASVKEGKSLSALIRESLERRIKEGEIMPPTKEDLLSLMASIKPTTPMFKNPTKYINRLREESDEHRSFSC